MQQRYRLSDTQMPVRHEWLGLRTRVAARRRKLVVPQALPMRAEDAEAYVHMRYARTLPLLARGDLAASRRRLALAQIAPEFDGLVITPERPLSMLRILNRCGFVPAKHSDLTLLATAFYELSIQLGWRVFERHADLSHDAFATAVRWPDEDLCAAPVSGEWRLFVRVAGDGLQLAVYSREKLFSAE